MRKKAFYQKSFTLVEVMVVIGIMGLVIGGLMVSMREIVEGELLLKKLQQVEEESRFIVDSFSQDAQYSELESIYKQPDASFNSIGFILSDKKLADTQDPSLVGYTSQLDNSNYFLKRAMINVVASFTTTLNSVPLESEPIFKVKRISHTDGATNYLISLTSIFKIETGNGSEILIPVQTSVISRTFEF